MRFLPGFNSVPRLEVYLYLLSLVYIHSYRRVSLQDYLNIVVVCTSFSVRLAVRTSTFLLFREHRLVSLQML